MAEEKDTEQKIFEAARRVFLREGTARARMQDIADEAGINKALLHYYFRSKDRLSQAVFREALSRMLPRIFAHLEADQPLEEKVEAIVQTYLDFARENPHVPSFVLYELHYHPDRMKQFVRSIGAPEFDMLAAQIEERVEAGTLRPIAPEDFVVNLVSLCIFPFIARPMVEVLFRVDDARFEAFIERRRQELPSFFLNALRP